jgi:hypothetical protein
MPLHITKVAFGSASVENLAASLAARAIDGETFLTTRYKPKRADEIEAGGSLYWILKHHLVARSPILGFGEAEAGRTIIRIRDRLIPVRALPRRAHQGWRYLDDTNVPVDLGDAETDELAAMPPKLVLELAALALL